MSQAVLEYPSPAAALAKPRWMPYGDMIRIVGTIAVVVGHVSDMILFQHSKEPHVTPSYDWWVCNFYDAFTRWAVPAYIMLSGSLLLDPARREAPHVFYRKRLMRIGVPMVFFSAVFMWFSVDYTGWVTTWRQAWKNLLLGEPYAHMHFIFRIAGLYAFTPMLRIFLRHSSRAMQIGTVIALLCIFSGDSIANGFTGTEYSGLVRFAPFLGFYLAGYLLRDPHLSWRGVSLCWIGFIATCLALAWGTGGLVYEYGMNGYPSMGMLLYDFLSPVRVIMAIFAWLVLTHTFSLPFWSWKRVSKPVHWVASTTLGLYLVHPLFRDVLHAVPPQGPVGAAMYKYIQLHAALDHGTLGAVASRCIMHLLPHSINAVQGFHGPWPSVWLGVPIVTAMVYLPALVLTAILMKIPVVRRITG